MANPIPQTCAFYDLPCGANWLKTQLEALGDWYVQTWIDLGTALVNVIPVPDFLVNLQPVTIPSSVSFFIAPFNLEYGIGIIVSAYIARFILRRIPIIG